jgi:hypothetical protein
VPEIYTDFLGRMESSREEYIRDQTAYCLADVAVPFLSEEATGFISPSFPGNDLGEGGRSEWGHAFFVTGVGKSALLGRLCSEHPGKEVRGERHHGGECSYFV